MPNFCTNCGSKLEKYYNYCINCGTKIDKSDIKQHKPSSNQNSNRKEIKKAKTVKVETPRITKQKEMSRKEIKENERASGGYCSLDCIHCYEEFYDSGGGLSSDYDSEGYVDYYCRLGHSISYGSFCEDYE